jgi:hypothetical protein
MDLMEAIYVCGSSTDASTCHSQHISSPRAHGVLDNRLLGLFRDRVKNLIGEDGIWSGTALELPKFK